LRAIFVSYRRSDSQGEAGRLLDDLVTHFGEQKVFMDVAGIEAGRDFRKAIEESVANCGVLLVVMGPSWLSAKNEAGVRRLDDPADFVREEVAAALRRDIPVIPVLVRGAEMPRAEQLPECLKDLAYRNCVELTHARWRSDVQLLLEPLRRLIGSSGEVKAVTATSEAKISDPTRGLPEGTSIQGKREEGISSRFDAATLQRISRELALDIGPIADVVVKRAAAQCDSTEGLYLKVAEEIESPQQREIFLRKMSASVLSEAPVGATLPRESSASRRAPTPAKKTSFEPVPTALPPRESSSFKKRLPLVMVAGAILLVLALVVGMRVLASKGSGPSASQSSSQQGTSKTESVPEETRPAAAQAPIKPRVDGSGLSAANPGSGSEAGLPQRVRLPAEISQGLLTSRVEPTYPSLARQAHIQGAVVLDVDISKDGTIEGIRAVSGHPMLIPAAIDAVKQWHYKPYTHDGAPVPAQMQIVVNFTLLNR
jgi:TonB family protein